MGIGSNAYYDGDWKRIDSSQEGANIHIRGPDGASGREFRFLTWESGIEGGRVNIAEIGSERTFIRYGNVGIGTINPEARLDVSGEVWINEFQRTLGTIGIQHGSNGEDRWRLSYAGFSDEFAPPIGGYRPGDAGLRIEEVNNGNTLVWFEHGSSPLTAFQYNVQMESDLIVDDNVGIGTMAPEAALHVESSLPNGFILERDSGNNSNIEFRNSGGSMFAGLSQDENFAIGTDVNLGSAGILTVTPPGNVGIGTVNPATTLDVDGNIQASGEIFSSGEKVLTESDHEVSSGVLLLDTGGSFVESFATGFEPRLVKLEVQVLDGSLNQEVASGSNEGESNSWAISRGWITQSGQFVSSISSSSDSVNHHYSYVGDDKVIHIVHTDSNGDVISGRTEATGTITASGFELDFSNNYSGVAIMWMAYP